MRARVELLTLGGFMAREDFPDTRRSAWGKSAANGAETHHLAHHSADVAAVFLVIMRQRVWRARAEAAFGHPITEAETRCLAALVFLHDIGKLAPGFQAKGWPENHGLALRGHLQCGWHWTGLPRADALAGAVTHLARWPGIADWLMALFAHHGRPVPRPREGEALSAFPLLPGYDWQAEETVLGRAMLNWFPEITTSCPPPPEPTFLHFFCGLLNLADWVASDRRGFPFEAEFRPSYWQTALDRAENRVAEIELVESATLREPAAWHLISDHTEPRPAQRAVGALPTTEHLVLLEAETGSGKTEAALWRFAKLLEAGEVDALYFAVPTRAAARQLHGRVNDALTRMFAVHPEAVLAIPGQILAGEAKGTRLPDFEVVWDDTQVRPARWAAEHAARYLTARVAVGTVDQVALAGLQVKFAHLRGAALSRALLVIDEVHASDPYMTETQLAIVRSHLGLGGHVLLMSATLGAAARRRWRNEMAGNLEKDASLPYPAVWTSGGLHPIQSEPGGGKTVRIDAHSGWSGSDAADLAIQASAHGARVLVIRNTVARAQETFAACRERAPGWLLQIAGIPTLHHSRFAAEDRALLDRAVEQAIGKDSPLGGRIVIGTQTLEQSLDLCADLLITDLCPMDVLLQRIGRLHRHTRARPDGFAAARAVVLCPPGGLDALTRAAENGLGAFANGPSLSGVYVDVPGLAATLEQITLHPVWQIPVMNRSLVEAATHPEALDRLAEERGWQAYRQRVTGKALAEMRTADLCILDRSAPLECFPDDEKIRTRLGEEGVILSLPAGTVGAFGAPVHRLALPAQWSRGLTGDEPVSVDQGPPMTVTVSDMVLIYGPEGLRQRGGNGT
ncbi:CRISPR-associated helicase Cas3' [Plastorhodobacter daqingensis]|uniref:CRISPR-associated helicase Cas3 n=1 Tax=Plastorhodobacter daqingensis TaxID=1387281 RepID=A0ABW2UQY2_9RHOB